jgi:hypothetical protein
MRKTLTLVVSLLLCLPVWAMGSHQSHHSSTTHTRSATATHSHSSSHSRQYYTNVDGKRVHRPVHATHTPARATAKCGDGTYSFSQHSRGTCSHHGGVSSWIRQ